jgi:hypothetical protein
VAVLVPGAVFPSRRHCSVLSLTADGLQPGWPAGGEGCSCHGRALVARFVGADRGWVLPPWAGADSWVLVALLLWLGRGCRPVAVGCGLFPCVEEDKVAEFGGAAVCPVVDVVALAVAGWAVAAGEGAAAVA